MSREAPRHRYPPIPMWIPMSAIPLGGLLLLLVVLAKIVIELRGGGQVLTAVLLCFAILILIGTPIAFVLGARRGASSPLTTTGRTLLLLVPQQIFFRDGFPSSRWPYLSTAWQASS